MTTTQTRDRLSSYELVLQPLPIATAATAAITAQTVVINPMLTFDLVTTG